ncbi:hypothetical protein AGABI2DRAFT_209748 [Agaricus bisporus var. bisporus H97]|uniref:hypothetical protein n=1 Tax=Agaricus bisporus var. bisporus (strain H97 / ATCC MYA-4626 / FGSC 10389) TaxID=936046 RepID=UPI00029F527B|nr:hypothetical protein AGABI2DRAFT_209748 [Agaricus bisporus var. bisporus H97]EKV44051.1 hypothetical protein AGABI2DRAFT_209748 [Agaricus bisporus var. bisporus H97]
MAFKQYFFALVLALPAFAQQQTWGQCGGMGWSGQTTCVSGTSCVVINPFYSQCIPGGPPSTTTPPTTTPPTTTPPTSSDPPTSTDCPTTPSNLSFSNTFLPDPFTFADGQTKVTTKAQWNCRRAELSKLLQQYELGTLPPKPSSVTGSLNGNTLSVSVSEGGKSISFSATITRPSGATAPYPAIIGVGGINIPAPAGVAVINFNNNDIALQTDGSSRGRGKFYDLYGSNHSAGAMIAWAWGISRIIDVLEMVGSQSQIDLSKLAVSGCSRNGKGALVAGAFDERIALTIPQESGSGGGGCWRISDDMLHSGIETQTASEIVGENVWFSPNFNQWANRVNNLPFDHHLLAALVAPRALLVIDNTSIDWLGPRSVWGCMSTANKVWQALGVADSMGVSQVGNHNHCAFPSNERPDLDAYINKFLKGQSTNTGFLKTDGGGSGFVESRWVNWQVPRLS